MPEVTVSAKVSGGNLVITVDPWSLDVPSGTTATVKGGPGVTIKRIWFYAATPLAARKWMRKHLRSWKMKGPKPRIALKHVPEGKKRTKKTKKYGIEFTFELADGSTRKAMVDPDMVMDT